MSLERGIPLPALISLAPFKILSLAPGIERISAVSLRDSYSSRLNITTGFSPWSLIMCSRKPLEAERMRLNKSLLASLAVIMVLFMILWYMFTYVRSILDWGERMDCAKR